MNKRGVRSFCLIPVGLIITETINQYSLLLFQEFAGEDTSDLFLEEREASLRQAQEEKHKIQMSVPGILNPHEIPEEMCD